MASSTCASLRITAARRQASARRPCTPLAPACSPAVAAAAMGCPALSLHGSGVGG